MTRPLSPNDRAIKGKELKWFKTCQNLCSLFPPGEPEQNPSHAPQPDIVLAKKAFERSSNEQVVVSVSWDPHQEFSPKTKTDIPEQIARTVIAMLANGVNSWLPDWTTAEGKFLGRHVGDIWIWPQCDRSEWTSAESATEGGDVCRVQQTIHGKESLVSKYRGTCNDVWLLIVAEGRLSTFFSPDEDFPSAVFDTSFDQIFLFDAFHNQVRRLATRAI